MLGVGECSDTSNLATLLLCKKGCSSLINTLILIGEKPFGNEHSHALIVIGNCDGLTNNISSLNNLSNDCILLDPLLGVVGQANQFQRLEIENDYLKLFKISKIAQKITTDPVSPQLPEQIEKVFSNARKISEIWKAEFGSYSDLLKHKSNQQEKPLLLSQTHSLFSENERLYYV